MTIVSNSATGPSIPFESAKMPKFIEDFYLARGVVRPPKPQQ
jgi:hypothetical protein